MLNSPSIDRKNEYFLGFVLNENFSGKFSERETTKKEDDNFWQAVKFGRNHVTPTQLKYRDVLLSAQTERLVQ